MCCSAAFRRPSCTRVSSLLRTKVEPGQMFRHFLGVSSGWRKLLGVEDRIFTARHLRLYGSGLVIACVGAPLLTWALGRGEWAILPNGKLGEIDFCWIWMSGVFAVSSDSAQIYDPSVLSAAQNTIFGPGKCVFYYFDYPPTSLLLTYLLGALPYLVAFVVWVVVTLLLYLTAVFRIVLHPAALIAALAPAAVVKNIQLGHNGFLTAALIGLSLTFIERRPWVSGIFLGLLTYKPQFGVLFPLALLASRNWRALGSGAIASLTLGVIAAFAFGYQGWPSFISSLFGRNSSLSPNGDVELNLQSVYGLLHWAGTSGWVAWTVQLIIAVIVAAAVCTLWAKQIPYSLKAAIICVGAVTVSPYLLAYDLCILSIAVAFLVKDGMSRGFLPGERTGLLICFTGLFPVATPIAPMICAILLFLIVRRIIGWRYGLFTPSQEGPAIAQFLPVHKLARH
jgi:arabinofuranan 3-O-arabinosyltransferase